MESRHQRVLWSSLRHARLATRDTASRSMVADHQEAPAHRTTDLKPGMAPDSGCTERGWRPNARAVRAERRACLLRIHTPDSTSGLASHCCPQAWFGSPRPPGVSGVRSGGEIGAGGVRRVGSRGPGVREPKPTSPLLTKSAPPSSAAWLASRSDALNVSLPPSTNAAPPCVARLPLKTELLTCTSARWPALAFGMRASAPPAVARRLVNVEPLITTRPDWTNIAPPAGRTAGAPSKRQSMIECTICGGSPTESTWIPPRSPRPSKAMGALLLLMVNMGSVAVVGAIQTPGRVAKMRSALTVGLPMDKPETSYGADRGSSLICMG